MDTEAHGFGGPGEGPLLQGRWIGLSVEGNLRLLVNGSLPI